MLLNREPQPRLPSLRVLRVAIPRIALAASQFTPQRRRPGDPHEAEGRGKGGGVREVL